MANSQCIFCNCYTLLSTHLNPSFREAIYSGNYLGKKRLLDNLSWFSSIPPLFSKSTAMAIPAYSSIFSTQAFWWEPLPSQYPLSPLQPWPMHFICRWTFIWKTLTELPLPFPETTYQAFQRWKIQCRSYICIQPGCKAKRTFMDWMEMSFFPHWRHGHRTACPCKGITFLSHAAWPRKNKILFAQTFCFGRSLLLPTICSIGIP